MSSKIEIQWLHSNNGVTSKNLKVNDNPNTCITNNSNSNNILTFTASHIRKNMKKLNMNAHTKNLKNDCLSPTRDWKYMALNIEVRHLCQLENRGDRWSNSIFKQVVRAMYVPKNDLFFAKSSALVCTHFFPQHQAAFGGHGWRKSHSFAKIRLGMPT